MKLRTLPLTSLHGKRVLLRVDWNVPLRAGLEAEALLKLTRTSETIKRLQKKGAIVIVMTHIGRPEHRDLAWSTKRLLPFLKRVAHLSPTFHSESVSSKKELAALLASLKKAEPGSVRLLENVRFEKGEEENVPALARAYATLGDLFVNDAFASSHRAHTSVVGIAKFLPAYAGLALAEEVAMAEKLLKRSKSGFVAFLGGAKLSTKLPLIQRLSEQCASVCVGGVMATTLLAGEKKEVGKSLIEKTFLKDAQKLLKEKKNIVLPVDVMVTKKISSPLRLRAVGVDEIEADDIVVDVGPRTLEVWGQMILKAKTILWNGPVGLVEVHACGFGSRFLARTIAKATKGDVFMLAGGGDTIPVLAETKTLDKWSSVSTGGGALLDFLTTKGALPGLEPLILKK
jgi:phosphoglycerate kinase